MAGLRVLQAVSVLVECMEACNLFLRLTGAACVLLAGGIVNIPHHAIWDRTRFRTAHELACNIFGVLRSSHPFVKLLGLRIVSPCLDLSDSSSHANQLAELGCLLRIGRSPSSGAPAASA